MQQKAAAGSGTWCAAFKCNAKAKAKRIQVPPSADFATGLCCLPACVSCACSCFMRWHVCLSTYTNNGSSSSGSDSGSADSSCCRQTSLEREREGGRSGAGRRQQESFAVSQSRRRRWHMAIFHYPRLTRLTLRLRQPLGLRLRRRLLQTAGTGSGFVSVYFFCGI